MDEGSAGKVFLPGCSIGSNPNFTPSAKTSEQKGEKIHCRTGDKLTNPQGAERMELFLAKWVGK